MSSTDIVCGLPWYFTRSLYAVRPPRNLKAEPVWFWNRFMQMFSSTLHRSNLKMQQLPAILDCVWVNRGILWLSWRHGFRKASFSVLTKTQSQRFQISSVWRAFSKKSVFVIASYTEVLPHEHACGGGRLRDMPKERLGDRAEKRLRMSSIRAGKP